MTREINVWVGFRWMAGWLIKSAGLLLATAALSVDAAQTDIPGPAGSGAFGTTVTVLPNGNIVVTDPNGPVSNVGAVYLYSPTGVLISTVTGSSTDDRVGSGGIIVLRNGNYVIRSPLWNNNFATDVGAVTWANGSTGLSGVVSPANSLIGTTSNDFVGTGGVNALSNGNYVVSSAFWDNGATVDVGAVTWANGSTGFSGEISPANSLIGTTANDQVGGSGFTALSNGNYVVANFYWNNGAAVDAGAVTWADGSAGLSGTISVANSLIGTTTNDFVGFPVVTALSNGNYVVGTTNWHNSGGTTVGAATWGNGSTGLSGVVSPANSLIGTTLNDAIGNGVTALSNGNYVVASPNWNNGATLDVGAVTWANGSTGLSGVLSAGNSLIGTTASDQVGSGGVTALRNGNYVVASYAWGSGDVGAVTWANGSAGLSGIVSPANSLIGTTTNDYVGRTGVTALSNGNYVVRSPNWGSGDVGAATWANGSTGLSGVVSPANSLVGTTTSDQVGSDGVTALSNGNYVVRSSFWNNGPTADVGAATWANGSTGLSAAVSPGNSLVGTTASDQVGYPGVTALTNGNYVVGSQSWGSGDVGAVTWANGSTGLSGVVLPANSLIGTATGDYVGSPGVTALTNGDYVVASSLWDNGATVDAGAVTLALGDSGLTGTILAANSVRGTAAFGGNGMVFGYDAAREQLVVGQPASNIVSLFRLSLDLIFTNGFE